MKRSIGLWQLVGFGVVSLSGTVLHFLYEWTGESLLVAPFSGVNESTWEHMKLLFWPMLIFAIIESFFFKDRGDFWCVKARGILLGTGLIPIIFYTYNGSVGKSPDWINIAIFFISAGAAYLYESRLFKKETARCRSKIAAISALFALAIAFVVLTFIPPELGIFRDPLTGGYGI